MSVFSIRLIFLITMCIASTVVIVCAWRLTKPQPAVKPQPIADAVDHNNPASQTSGKESDIPGINDPPILNIHSQLYSDPNSSAASALDRANNTSVRTKLKILASTPTGIWQTSGSDLLTFVNKITQAKEQNRTPVVVFYAIPNIGCGTHGNSSLEDYNLWVAKRVSELKDSKPIVVLEPDAVAMFDCLSASQLSTRIMALNTTIDALYNINATVYIDAGHAAWVQPNIMAERLNKLNLAKVRGISVNVSNFQNDEISKTYAVSILSQIKQKDLQFVIDSSRNGNDAPSNHQWCNPLGRKIGQKPHLKPSGKLDGYLWIKVPGESDGTGSDCSYGPTEGSFWLDYAINLVS